MAETTVPPQAQNRSPSPPPIPPLQNGDHLTREEFHRRYEAMPEVKKAELIDGVVYMPSPVRHYDHSNPQFNLVTFAGIYVIGTPGIQGGDNGSLKLDNKCEPQPDVYLIVSPSHGGRARIDGGYVVSAPDWIGEVAASSVSYDLHAKLEVYRRHGVLEYVVWRVLDREIDWFVLRGEKFERLLLTAEGLYMSEVFPGLWLDPSAMVNGDLVTMMQALQKGLASPEHQDFVQRLAGAAAKPRDHLP
jgi:Uma2 family endonuclease